MTYEELVELHAEALWDARRGKQDEKCVMYPWDEQPVAVQAVIMKESRAALAAIRAAGVRLMPEEATEEMMRAAWDAYTSLDATLAKVYTAMRDAGEIKPGDGA